MISFVKESWDFYCLYDFNAFYILGVIYTLNNFLLWHRKLMPYLKQDYYPLGTSSIDLQSIKTP